MGSIKAKFVLILVLIFVPQLSYAFNIDLSGESEFVIIKQSPPSTFSEDKPKIPETPFFGFKLQVDLIGVGAETKIGLATSAPLEVVPDYKSNENEENIISKEPIPQKRSAYIPTDAMGVIYMCDVLQTRFTNRSNDRVYNCSNRAFIDRALTSGEISDDDAFGLSLTSRTIDRNKSKLTEQNQFVSCAPLRLRDCGSFLKAEGACYVSKNVPSRGDSSTSTIWTKKTPCEESCIRKDIDLMYVIDGSYSVGMEDFLRVKKWIKDVTEGFDLTNQVQVGVVQYSYANVSDPSDQRYLKTEIALGQYKTLEGFSDALGRISYQGYQTFTAHAITKTVKEDFNGPNNRYPDARRVMILLTDGRADDRNYLPNATQYAVANGVESFAIGIGNFDQEELETIAGDSDRVLTVEGFEDLGGIVSRLQNDIQVLEGATSPDQHNGLSHCEVGLSAQFDKSGALYLGAVGAWDWSGTIVKYDTANDQNPDIPSYEEVQKVLVNRTKESYLGYSLTSGFYNGQSSGEYVAIGAPRYNLEGAVVIYKPESGNPNFTNPSTIYPNANNAQLGSYFGGAMLTMDINDDSKDDLLVGAPLYIGTSYDLGRVYVYMATNSDNPRDWAQGTRGPIILTGTAVGGRFGSAIASAGDLNKDGYNDVIVGAPYTDDNKGSVYVFHGTGDGLNTNAQQEINAKSLSNNNLRYFGLSIQGGQDLDGNDYPDVAVGAPKSDAVVIFRTRPVVSFTGSLSFSEAKINVFDCFRKVDRNCLSLTACLTGSGAGVEDTIDVTYSISLDSSITSRDQKRVEFQGASTPDAQYMISGTEVLSRGDRLCIRHNITVKGTISDYSTPIEANFAFDLDPKHTATPLSSIRDPNAVHSYTSNTSFARGCGSDDKCKYNLVLNGDVQVPSATLTANGKDLTDGGKILVISRQTQFSPLTMKMNLTNTGDNAFDVRVSVTYNDQLGWKLGNILSSNPDPSISCVTDDSSSASESTNVDGYRSKLLVYRQNRLLGSIMESGHWCSFEVNLTSTLLGLSGTLPNINVTVYAFTIGGIADDTEKSDNTFTATNPIRYRADATVSSRSPVTTIPFNFTDANSTIVSVRQIGDNVPITYQVDSQGYSNIPISTISFTYPYTMLEGSMQHLLYLYKYSCISPQNNAQCTCDESVVNPYQLLEGYATSNTTGLNNVTVIANPNLINRSLVYDCGNKNNQTSFECQTFTCNVTNLQANDLLEFHVEFRLWSQSLNLMNDTNVTFVSHFVYDTSGSNLLINNNGENVTRISRGINTIARLFTEPIVVEQENNLWIYIVAAVAGLLLLVIIVIILWKLGFFKSKYAEKKEALEWSGPDQS